MDLLGLGMMAVLEESLDLIREHYGEEVDLAQLPADDPAVYGALQKADTIGMFQVESRAQMSCLPRLRPKKFYDIVVQVAIIRPGPIVGKMLHPYLRRGRVMKRQRVCIHRLKPVLKRTLGVPLFQEQLLRMAMIAANFTGGEAEELRRAMGFKRSEARMKEIETRLRSGMAANGIVGETQDQIVQSITCVRAVRIPGIARGELCADRLRKRLSEVPLSGGVHGGDSKSATHGVLSPRRRWSKMHNGTGSIFCRWMCTGQSGCARWSGLQKNGDRQPFSPKTVHLNRQGPAAKKESVPIFLKPAPASGLGSTMCEGCVRKPPTPSLQHARSGASSILRNACAASAKTNCACWPRSVR